MKKTFRNLFMFVVFAYLYIPIIILVVNSFNADRYGLQWKGFSWNWYERLFNNDTLVQATLNSVTIAFFAATLSTILGALTSIALYRYKFRGKQMVGGLLFIVMMSPDIVMAVSMLVLFMMLGIQLGFISLLIAHITFCLPYVVITISARLSDFDGQNAGSGERFRRKRSDDFTQNYPTACITFNHFRLVIKFHYLA